MTIESTKPNYPNYMEEVKNKNEKRNRTVDYDRMVDEDT